MNNKIMKILLTRPKNDSIKTSKTLRKFSLAFEISPLLKIKKHKCDVDYSKFDIIIFSSKNGVRFSDIDKRKIKEQARRRREGRTWHGCSYYDNDEGTKVDNEIDYYSIVVLALYFRHSS